MATGSRKALTAGEEFCSRHFDRKPLTLPGSDENTHEPRICKRE